VSMATTGKVKRRKQQTQARVRGTTLGSTTKRHLRKATPQEQKTKNKEQKKKPKKNKHTQPTPPPLVICTLFVKNEAKQKAKALPPNGRCKAGTNGGKVKEDDGSFVYV